MEPTKAFQPANPATPTAPATQPNASPSTIPASVGLPPVRPHWRFWVPFLLQMAIVLPIPLQNYYTYASGRTVVLQTVPVDPYDFLRGYHQIVSYTISNLGTLTQLPGGKEILGGNQPAQRFYVVLEAPDTHQSTPASASVPPVWKAVRISRTLPKSLPSHHIALQGRLDSNHPGQVIYGLEKYYMPEERRDEINGAIAQTQIQPQGQRNQAIHVAVKVDAQGRAVADELWIANQKLKF